MDKVLISCRMKVINFSKFFELFSFKSLIEKLGNKFLNSEFLGNGVKRLSLGCKQMSKMRNKMRIIAEK